MTLSISFEVFPPKSADGLDGLRSTVEPTRRGRTTLRVRDIRSRRLGSRAIVRGHRCCALARIRRRWAPDVRRSIPFRRRRGDRPLRGTRRDADRRPARRSTRWCRRPVRGPRRRVSAHGRSRAQHQAARRVRRRRLGLPGTPSAVVDRRPRSRCARREMRCRSRPGDDADVLRQRPLPTATGTGSVRRHHIPIVPGIFPIHSFPAVARFADRCGASIPSRVAARFAGLDDDAGATHKSRHGARR